ncbi:parallel beta-helix domain-containing protein [Pontixanthobacter sp. CEM42]|uniref:parallel beta-helix domain-containing protein n=1 Tax=Pontixanthobacter sp. CEM42 TaxID=2792077 RepID=UPI001ADEDAAE|nr:parallel beta-helix domain-containing protein [Pontixanthobacter sp. CEM42]
MNKLNRMCLAAGALLLAAQPAWAETITIAPGDGAQERLQEALILAEPGDEIVLEAGRFALTDGLSLDVDGVTVRGAGMDQTVLDFSNQMGAGEGLLVTSDNVVLREFGMENSKGDGIKSKGADNIVYYKLRVEWTRGPHEENGAYAIYPVESENVLVDSVTTIAASDAGIYVGQSKNIIVRNSVAKYNVAGIEIENSYGADVYNNLAVNNTGGILVFDLPDIPQQGGRDVRVFENIVVDNNTRNFAPEGNIVASVPSGMGVMVMSHFNVEVFGNVFAENATGNVLITAYPNETEDADYNPLPVNILVKDNIQGRAGYKPAMRGGEMLAAAFGGTIPPVTHDGNGSDIVVQDGVPVLSLGFTKPAQPFTEAQPSVVDLSGDADKPLMLKPIVLPEAMEAVVKQ